MFISATALNVLPIYVNSTCLIPAIDSTEGITRDIAYWATHYPRRAVLGIPIHESIFYVDVSKRIHYKMKKQRLQAFSKIPS